MNDQPTLLSYLNAAPHAANPPLIGVFRGNGAGPSLVDGALAVLDAASRALGIRFQVEDGGVVGEASTHRGGPPLPESAVAFCAGIFRRGGAILSGPGGGRYVYALRRRFDLFAKFVPVRPIPELARAGRLDPRSLRGIDLLIVRDNIGGIYQGTWSERQARTGRLAAHRFQYHERDVRRLALVAARAAAGRRGTLHVVVKDGGVPAISSLWRDVAAGAAREHGVAAEFMNVDLAAYELIQNPARFDVIVAPNLFGDILADVAGVLVSSRGVTFSGNFDPRGHAVYQTNHGCAHDLAGADAANPAGQILSLSMLLRESGGLSAAAALIERSLAAVWALGWRTADVAEPGCRVVGTREFVERVAAQVLLPGEPETPDARCLTVG